MDKDEQARAARAARKDEQDRERAAQVARVSADAALDESVAPELRSYYAGVALFYDRRARGETKRRRKAER